MARTAEPILPDLLRPGLTLVFCGTAAGERSAREGAYYAHPGNLFWRALHEAGITPRRFAPAEFSQLSDLGIGLTDLAKRHSGNDADLPRDAFDVPALVDRIEACRPRLLAFTSKTAARVALGRAIVACGVQPERLGGAQVFALPSPSGRRAGIGTSGRGGNWPDGSTKCVPETFFPRAGRAVMGLGRSGRCRCWSRPAGPGSWPGRVPEAMSPARGCRPYRRQPDGSVIDDLA